MYKRDVSCSTDHGDTRLYIPQKHEIYEMFYSFSNVIAENFIKNILLQMKNGLSLSQQQLQVIMYYMCQMCEASAFEPTRLLRLEDGRRRCSCVLP